jgi:soluble lytic murein transglycosylase-like protein
VADIFYFVDEDGSFHYSDERTDDRFRVVAGSEEPLPMARDEDPPRSIVPASARALEDKIAAAARASRVEPGLLHAVIRVESGYNAKAISPKGALGLMQLMPATTKRYGVVDPFDAAQNLSDGARHLRHLLDLFANNKALALAAYNAGAGAVAAHGGRIPPFAETASYVPAVLKYYELLRKPPGPAYPMSTERQ